MAMRFDMAELTRQVIYINGEGRVIELTDSGHWPAVE